MRTAPAAISRRSLLTLDVDAPRAGRWLRVRRTLMACSFEITLPESAVGVAAAREALDRADQLESQLTVFRATSEVSRVNAGAGAAPVAISEEVFALLARCRRLHDETDGAFDVTTTPLSRCWGFLARAPRVPSRRDIDAARLAVGMRQVRLDPATHAVSFARPGIELNFGSIGKGYALDCMGHTLRARGVARALVSAGGSSILAIDKHRTWTVDVTSPRLPRPIATLRLSTGALGTSGAGEQFVIEDGQRYGHVIDPATGWPARGVLSASAVTRDAETADALSTAFLIGGPPAAERYCRTHPGTLAFITLDERPVRTCVFGGYPGAHLEVRRDADT
jgi:thiamine biosynthesis lipoprotein